MKSFTRRVFLSAFAAVVALGTTVTARAEPTRVLKLSHQFPASTGDSGDFRDQLARKFAAEVESRSGGSLKVEIYPGSSLMKTKSQFGALRKGILDMSVLPLAYGGGEVPEVTLTLMPALVQSYEQGLRWKTAPIGAELEKILEAKGIKIVTWVWQAGGIASRGNPIVAPEDARTEIAAATRPWTRCCRAPAARPPICPPARSTAPCPPACWMPRSRPAPRSSATACTRTPRR